jgi:hypothetical protein
LTHILIFPLAVASILETGNDSFRLRASADTTKPERKMPPLGAIGTYLLPGSLLDENPGSTLSDNQQLDASFNKGGDTIAFDEVATDYLAVQSGSSVRLTGSDTTALIPIGTAGATLAFGDGSDTRTILFDTSIPAITIGGQQIGFYPVQLMAA